MNHAYATQLYVSCQPPTPSSTGLSLSIHGATELNPTIEMEHQIAINCSGVQIGRIYLCPTGSACIAVSADGLFTEWRLLSEVPDELHIAAILLYPESGVIGAPYYRIQINRTIPIARAA